MYTIVRTTILFLCAIFFAAIGQAQTLEKPNITIAVGGKATLFYLPLTLAERLGYFKDEGLNVEIPDFAGGAKSLQALIGGSADIVAGGFDHTIHMQTMAQKLSAFVLLSTNPGIAMGISKAKAASYSWPKDLKGMKVGVTAPGSSSHMMLDHILASVQLKPDDVSVIGVGTGPQAVAAMKSGQIDAIVNVEPVMTILEKQGTITIVAETTSSKGTREVFGGSMLIGTLYTKASFIKDNPKTIQAVTNAMVRALRWIKTATPDQLVATLPSEYLLGDKALYLEVFEKLRENYSPDGMITAAAVKNSYEVLKAHNAAVKRSPVVWLDQTYDMTFVKNAAAKLK
jgi:NitT/TauT family transport system substrate-binding protein